LQSSRHFNADPACRTGVLVRRLRTFGLLRSGEWWRGIFGELGVFGVNALHLELIE
jgi:hypothetical protein